MKKLIKILTCVLFLYSNCGFSQNACEEVVLGEIGKSHWRDSWSDGLRGELVKQIQKKDDLFDKLLPEIEFGISPIVDFKFRFTRSVRDHQPRPKNGTITSEDLFSLKVQNKLDVEFAGKKEGPYLFAEGNAGVSLVHSGSSYPNFQAPPCEIYKRIIDLQTARGKQFYDAACEYRDKSTFLKYYDKAVDFFSQKLGSGLKKIVNSEKKLEYAKDPLSPLKLHSMLGIPLDHTVFYENSNNLAIGDVVEHTTFYGLKPGGIKIDLFNFISPTYAHYRRAFRTISFKKMRLNKVMVEIEDTVLSGNETEIFRIRPKLLGILKLNFGEWSADDFRQQSLLQKFEIDINDPEGDGVKFFKEILKSAYWSEYFLHDDVLMETASYGDDVKTFSPVYRDSDGDDDKFLVKFPLSNVFKLEKRNYKKSETISYDEYTYVNGERFLKNEFKNMISFWGIPEVDRKFECNVKIFSNSMMVVEDNSSMNLECSYFNRFADNDHKSDVLEFMEMTTLQDLNSRHREQIQKVEYEKDDRINLYTNLSFSKKHIDRIIDASEEEIYHTLAKLIFGENAENVFAPKFHKAWDSARPITGAPVKTTRKQRNSREYKECSSLIKLLDITEGYDPLYSELSGIVGNGKGIEAYESMYCYNYYRIAKEVAESVIDFQNTIRESGRLQQALNIFEDLNKMGLYQSLLANLAGGVSSDNVRFTYILDLPQLESVLADTNGKKYDVENKEIRKSISSELDAIFHSRIKSLKITYNTCAPDILLVYKNLYYGIQDRKKINGKFTLVPFGGNREEMVTQQVIGFENMILNTDGEYISQIRLDENLTPDQAHNMFFEITNDQGMRLSREVKVYLKKRILESEE